MKKIILTFSFLFLAPISAFAAISFNPNPPLYFGTFFDVLCEEGNFYAAFSNSTGEQFVEAGCGATINGDIPVGSYTFLEASDEGINTQFLSDALLDPNLVSQTTLSILSSSTGTGSLFHIGNLSGVGTSPTSNSGVDLLAAIGTVSTGIFSNIFPYFALSAGIFISLYIIQQLIIFLSQKSKIKK